MGLTIGSLHMMGTLTKEQQAANPYRLERDGRVSLYDSGWDIWSVLLRDAQTVSRKTGKDVLVFYCYNEDAVALVLYRGGKAVAGGASSLDERLAQPPQNMGLIAEAFGVEDAGGATLERLMTDARADVMQQIGELAAYLKENGIGTIIHYPIPPHLSEAYAYLGFKRGDFPIAEQYADEGLSLPMYNGMTEEEQTYVIEHLNRFQPER